MILLKQWGNHLRLGNWWYLWAYMNKLSHLTGHQIAISDYFMWQYMLHPPLKDDGIRSDELFHFHKLEYHKEEDERIVKYFKDNPNRNIEFNLGSNAQSELWWIDSKEAVVESLKFKPEAIERIKEKYKQALSRKTIGITIRRGDFKNHGVFYQIPMKWYMDAVRINFPDYQDYNLVFFSDDIEEIKKFYNGENIYFADANNTHLHTQGFKFYHGDCSDQLILGSLMNNLVISNSTFSIWMGQYVDKINGGKVIHCGENFTEYGNSKYFNPDFYPKNWTLTPIK